jgi:hypothetical protein
MGLMPSTVQTINTVFAIRTLEVFRVIKLDCPRFGVQAFCRSLSAMNILEGDHNLETQFSMAYDAYLAILAAADARAAASMGRDTPSWILKNTCPSCQYTLDGERSLDPEMQCTIDGNNSLKRLKPINRQQRPDNRKTTGGRYLDPEEVNKWAKECIEVLKEEYAEELGRANYAAPEEVHCPDERWKNMQETLTALAQRAYDETGIMPCLCRHNFVLLLVDMVQSGEM